MVTAKLENTYALVVGIEKYEESSFNVKGPARDAFKFARWLLERGVPAGNISLCLSPLEENSALLEEATPLEVQEATEQRLYDIIVSCLSRKRGDLLFIYWAGHGIISSATDRRLICADATTLNLPNLNLNSLLVYLRSSAFGIRRHICIIDACANYKESALQQLTNKTFPQSKPTKDSKQFVLLAAREGITAKVSGKGQTGYFSEAVREELAREVDNSWPPDMERLTREIKQRFAQSDNPDLVKRLPVFFYYRGWDGDEEQYSLSQLTAPHNLDRSGVVKFVGRDEVLEMLHQQLQRGEQVAISAVAGMGGIGKTELALQYAQYHWQQGSYPGGICWLRAQEAEVEAQIISYARSKLGLRLPEDLKTLEEQLAYCWQHWCEGKVLLVLDDVRDYGLIKSSLPPSEPRFKVLITTREKLGAPVVRLDLDVLQPLAAMSLLQSLVGRERLLQEPLVARKLCKWLGYLPLGLELVGRYLSLDEDLSLAELLEELEVERLAAEALVETYPEMRTQLGVAAAFELSWKRLNQNAQVVAYLLSLFALAPIPWSLVESAAISKSTKQLREARRALVRLNLIKRTDKNTYQLHQLIRKFFSYKREESVEIEEMKRGFVAAMVAEAKEIPQSITKDLVKIFEPAIPHLEEVARKLTEFLADEDLIRLYYHLGWFYQSQGLYELAKPWLQECKTVAETRLGNQHPDFATSLNNLAELYRCQGRYSEAEPLYLQAINIAKHSLPEDHPSLATYLNNLALLYKSLGRYEEAEPLYKQAIEIAKHSLPEDHPSLANHLNNLAELYYFQGRYKEAELLYLQAINIAKRSPQENHLNLATTQLSNLASLYKSLGRYKEAEPLYLQALEIDKRSLPPNHPYLANSLNNLALLYKSLGRHKEAESLYLQAIEIDKHSLSPDHPNLAIDLNNLAGLYESLGRYKEAELLYQQALEIVQRSLPANHSSLANHLSNLAGLYRFQGRYKEAEALYLQAIEIDKRSLPANHSTLAAHLNNLANLYYSQGRYDEAEPLYLEALRICDRSLGREHPKTVTVWENFVDFLLKVVREGKESVLSEHPLVQELLAKIKEQGELDI
ncbi:MAG: tetratricopeptide repeat protein [Symploca sp. SIO1A3]|nr:tetratricopeptide repeat protein [Symploca sp. SIO1A3]